MDNEMTKCEGCKGECDITFEDVMGNPRCNVCLPGLADDEFADETFFMREY